MPDLAELRDVAVRVATEAAELLASLVAAERTLVATKSTATDMVTEMDRASEALVVRRLRELCPQDGIVGEEGASLQGESGVVWVVDPLDGTTNYLYGHPFWNVSVGATLDGERLAQRGHDDRAGALGRGSTRNGEPLRIPPAAPLGGCLVGTGFGYDPAQRVAQAEALATFLDRIRDIRRGGAAAADLCGVACGRLDAYYEHGLYEWDRVAGTVIAREAGARVEVLPSPIPGTGATGDCTVAAHPERFDELVEVLAGAGLLG